MDMSEISGAKWSLFPPGFTYRPPVENVCHCGNKHFGPGATCSRCQNELNAGR